MADVFEVKYENSFGMCYTGKKSMYSITSIIHAKYLEYLTGIIEVSIIYLSEAFRYLAGIIEFSIISSIQ